MLEQVLDLEIGNAQTSITLQTMGSSIKTIDPIVLRTRRVLPFLIGKFEGEGASKLTRTLPGFKPAAQDSTHGCK